MCYNMKRGKCLIFSAPSGSGKSTIVQWLMNEHPELKMRFSVSATSREPRCNNGVMERDGVEYYFFSPERFRQKAANGDFLEYEEVYEGRFYGTLISQVEEKLNAGYNVVFDIDVKGGVNVKKHYGNDAMGIFIQPPSIEELRRRLEGRNSETRDSLEERLAKAEFELTFAPKFDHIVVNDILDEAKAETLSLIQDFLKPSETT